METASNLQETDVPAFHAEDLDQVAEYRSMSVLAIVSLIFGLAAPVCFAAPVFLAIPLFGAAISLIALQRIAASDGALAGKLAATTGLALCVACATGTVTHAQVTRFMHVGQASRLGQEWIALILSGKTPEAFALTVQSTRSEPPEPPANLPDAAPEAPPYELFVAHPLVHALKSAGAGADVRYMDTLAYEPRSQRDCIVQQKFEVQPRNSSAVEPATAAEPIEVLLTLQFSRFPGAAQSRWLVLGYSQHDPSRDATAN